MKMDMHTLILIIRKFSLYNLGSVTLFYSYSIQNQIQFM